MQDVFEWGSIAFGAASALLWAWAAFKRVPKLTVPYGGVFKDDHPWIQATGSVAKVSRWASGVTAVAVFCQTGAAILEKLSS